MSDASLVVLGAGPAGATVAIGLRRLGYDVTVVNQRRRFNAIEGISARVCEGLRRAGLSRALSCIYPAEPRKVLWDGTLSVRNREYLIDRAHFDALLLEDLLAAGVKCIDARAGEIRSSSQGHEISLGETDGVCLLEASFLVEARGRQAPLKGQRLRGPETVTLISQWMDIPGRCGSAVESLEDGWVWMSRLPDGRCCWQLSVDAGSGTVPHRDLIGEYCSSRREPSRLARELFSMDETHLPGQFYSRSSTAVLALEPATPNLLKVGDAAMAVDPLSGNGVFQALSSALQAPAVINTLIKRPQCTARAIEFHQRRIENLFFRFARTGRDFYAFQRHEEGDRFWSKRSRWPDAEPLHASSLFSELCVVSGAVVRDDFIDEAQVVVSPDQPMGMWHLQGIELAPRVVRLKAGEDLNSVVADLPMAQKTLLLEWLTAQGFKQEQVVVAESPD